jgi:hypothetical protein
MAFEQAGLFENGVGGGYGGAIQSKMASQFASGWQLLARLDDAGMDKRTDAVGQLFINWRFCMMV